MQINGRLVKIISEIYYIFAAKESGRENYAENLI